ncbi:hypothetical protein ABIA26_001819 [Sinorhizobium fredii]
MLTHDVSTIPCENENESPLELQSDVDEQDEGDDQARCRQIVVLGHWSCEDMGIEEQAHQQGIEDNEKRLEPGADWEVARCRDRSDADDEITDDHGNVRAFRPLAAA